MEKEIDKYAEAQNRKDKAVLFGGFFGFIAFVVAVLFAMIMLHGCTTPKIVEEHHHHESKVDTMAVESVVEKRLQAMKEMWVQEVSAAVMQQHTEQSTQEQQKEKVTETITSWVDSLGRQMRQEQRTTERDISRQQQQREERMQQEWQKRLQTMIDSVNQQWNEKFNMMKGSWEDKDSTDVHQEPVPGDNRPWYKRMWDALIWMLIGGVVAGLLWLAVKYWSAFTKIL